MYLLLAGAIALPALAGLCLLATGHRLSPRLSRAVTLGLTLLATCCVAALSLDAGRDTGIAIEWLSGTGAMTLELERSGLYLLLATTGTACLVLLASGPGIGRHAPQAEGVVLVAVAATGVTLLAGHFLLRYAALEVVALCVAFAPLAELQGRRAIWLTSFVYLLLRLGDVGLLVAIQVLWLGSGTLAIGPALAATSQLPASTLHWVAAGMLVAVWVKVGGWPFQAWLDIGRPLPPRSRAWLYAVVLPNLGLYLLYRVAPLLADSGPVRAVGLWLGAGGAMLAAGMALIQPRLDRALPHVMAACGSLAVLAGAGGLAAAVWLSALAWTPVRSALHLAAERPVRSTMQPVSVALGAVLVCGWAACLTFWARSAGLPSASTYLAELGVALLVVWAVGAVQSSLRAVPDAGRSGPALSSARWVRLALLGSMAVCSPLYVGPLRTFLLEASHATLPAGPSVSSFMRYVLTSPVAWTVAALAAVAKLSGLRLAVPPVWTENRARDAGRKLGTLARVLRDAVEVGLLEGMLYRVASVVVGGSRLAYRILERDALEGGLRQAARAVVGASSRAYAFVEQSTFERGLRGIVRGTLGLARMLQDWHTGRLRRNLMWIAACAVLAIIVLLLL